MRLPSISLNNFVHSNNQRNYSKQSFGEKDPAIERQKYLITTYINDRLRETGCLHDNSECGEHIISNILALKTVLMNQINRMYYGSGNLTPSEMVELCADYAFLDLHGFFLTDSRGFNSFQIEKVAKKLKLDYPDEYSIENDAGTFVKLFRKGMISGYDCRIPLAVENLNKNDPTCHNYFREKKRILEEIKDIPLIDSNYEKIVSKVTELKKMLVKEINKFADDPYKINRNAILAIELAYYEKFGYHVKPYSCNEDVKSPYNGINDLSGIYKKFAEIYAYDDRMCWSKIRHDSLNDPSRY